MLRRKLSDILTTDNRQTLANEWNNTETGIQSIPLPVGTYEAQLENGELFRSTGNGTPGYKLRFRVLSGEYADRTLWCDLWLTRHALPYTKRALSQFRITDLEQLNNPLPRGICCRVNVTCRTGDDGRRFNYVQSFDVTKIDPPLPEPFAPIPAVPPTEGAFVACNENGEVR